MQFPSQTKTQEHFIALFFTLALWVSAMPPPTLHPALQHPHMIYLTPRDGLSYNFSHD